MVHKCEICHREFRTVSNLYQHQRGARYCLEKAKNLVCKYCNQVAADPNHLDDCLQYKIFKLEKELDETKEKHKLELEALQQKCDDFERQLRAERKFKDDLLIKTATKPTNKINNTNYNLSVTVFPPENEVKRIWENIICHDFLKGGIKAFARAGHETFLMEDGQSKIVCVDNARNKFMYMDSNQIYQYDVKLQKVTRLLFAPGADLALQFVKNFNVKDDDDERLFNQAMPVGHIANINSPSHKEFIRHLQHNIRLSTNQV